MALFCWGGNPSGRPVVRSSGYEHNTMYLDWCTLTCPTALYYDNDNDYDYDNLMTLKITDNDIEVDDDDYDGKVDNWFKLM